MDELTSIFGRMDNYWLAGAVALGIFVVFLIASFVVRCKLLPFLQKKRKQKKRSAFIPWLHGFARPFSLLLKIAGFCIAILVFLEIRPSPGPAWLARMATSAPDFLYRVLRISLVACIAWGLIESNNITELFTRGAKNHPGMHISKSVSRFLSAIFNVVVLAFAAVIIISEFGYDVSALITGLGLGGLTVALAAKDSAANFFGGLVLVTEKPFEIGDWISFDEVEGSVEDINIRSTKIRTGPGSLTIVPNATLSNANITNWSGGMNKRRANFNLSLEYATPKETMQEYLEAVRTMLETDPEIIQDSVLVRFSSLGDSALSVQVIFDSQKPAYGDFMRVKERINYALMDLAKSHGITFAFPTQTLEINDLTNKKA